MSYVVLARRFRPQNFDDIIGQSHVSKTLKNAILENRVAHAYLFSGPRGVGKTTTARILAKALNCKQGPTAKPCDKCPNCQEIINGSSVDVLEIDGASNRGIDEIRALRENVKFAPASGKYKVYIIDEAHQITDAAFNALLKTLEEPPSHVIFILATTDPQKIPITILSRCQRYRFRLLSSKEIMTTLEKISKTEKFEIDHEALQIITETSGGSLRDALSLLDQLASFVSGHIKIQDIQSLLGFLPKEIIYNATKSFAEHDSARIISLIKEIAEEGYSLMQFARDLREHFRRILLNKISPSVLELSTEEKRMLEEQKSVFPEAWLIRSGNLLSKMIDEMRWSDQPRLILELYLLRLAQPYVGLDELVDRLEKLGENVPVDAIPDETSRTRDPEKKIPEKIKAVEKEEKIESSGALHQFADTWEQVLAELRRTNPLAGNLLEDTFVHEVVNGSMVLCVKNELQQETVKRNQGSIEKVINNKSGKDLRLKTIIKKGIPQVSSGNDETEIVIKEENTVQQNQEVFRIEGNISNTDEVLPPDIKKIADKFQGKVTRKR
ncbi:MAG: DNA polymerase III subunit gamma/tau [Endomicrobiales bacterium]|nr:DNA polymerase III subunit gamma/tau [Endomicrobiales bacterium]